MVYDLLEGQGCSTTPFQRELVKLVLEHRDTKQKIVQCKTNTGINNVISQVSASSVNVNVNVNKESERISFFSSSPALDTQYNNILDSIFKKTTSLEINSYWYNHLKNISKPSARSIVSQLDYSCPLGYDPLAVPYVSTKSINTISSIKKTTAGKKGSLLYFVVSLFLVAFPPAKYLNRKCIDTYYTSANIAAFFFFMNYTF